MILPSDFALPRTVALSSEVLWSKVDNAKIGSVRGATDGERTTVMVLIFMHGSTPPPFTHSLLHFAVKGF